MKNKTLGHFALLYSCLLVAAGFLTCYIASGIGTMVVFALLGVVNYIVMSQLTLKQYAFTDPLTRAMNRRAWEMELKRWTERQVCVLVVDIDHFKAINDQFGHVAGDAVLRQIGQLMRSHIRQSDDFYRYGGEEFAIVIPDVDLQIAYQRAEKLRQIVESAARIKGSPVTISVGVASGTHLGDVFNQADEALYVAKNAGRNQVKIHVPVGIIQFENEVEGEHYG
jgi:diguanylate cyclase (GGDEF)-like protein